TAPPSTAPNALWACPRAAINSQRPPPAATCEHKLARAFNPRATHENTLVMRRSVAHFSCRQAPGVEPCCRIELLVDQGGVLRAPRAKASARPLPWKASRFIVPLPAAASRSPCGRRCAIGCAEPRPDVHSYGNRRLCGGWPGMVGAMEPGQHVRCGQLRRALVVMIDLCIGQNLLPRARS